MTEVSETVSPPARKPRIRGRFDWHGLRADLRGAIPDASLALIATGLIYWLLYARVANGTSPSTVIMPHLNDPNELWMYWMCQAFGWSALLWAYITVIFGLLRSGPRPRWTWLPPARVEKWHRTTSLTTIGLMFLHAAFFFGDQMRDNLTRWGTGRSLWTAFVDVFVPGGYATGTGRVAILLGLLALYLAIPLSLAFYLRHRTGSRMWVALHRFIIVVYVLSVWHTLLYGTNVWFDGTFRTLVWALQMPIAGLVLVRLLAPARPRERLRLRGHPLPVTVRLAGRLAVVATVLGLLAVIVTGVDGGRDPEDLGGSSPAVWPERWIIWAGLLALTLALVAVVLRLRPGSGTGTGTGTPGSPSPSRRRAPTDVSERQ
ncbi:ferric reductase-like transmembrane domain-containing protein [Streptomyces xiamenensis]|uniref:ferric reductase-like transmembrane domain-containing protein n=1 Tax=Streptomyces xiamenensis TaxID=408015 RepID=UPI0037D4CC31